jgi:hypothetical protein
MAERWWLMPVILAAQEAVLRKIVVQSHLWEIVLKTLCQKTPSPKKGCWSGSRYRP